MVYKFENTMKIVKLFMMSLLFMGIYFPAEGQTGKSGTIVDIITNKGTITVLLYDETPVHRDNFLQLVKAEFFNNIMYHRVINNFLIQVGDPRARRETNSQTTYYTLEKQTIPAEIIPSAFHHRGALNAARMGEATNPYRESSSTQFTIIQGQIQTDLTLNNAEKRIEEFYRAHLQSMYTLDLTKTNPDLSKEAVQALVDERIAARMEEVGQSLKIPEAHRTAYKTIGGAPHLDFNYTVFGEVLEGMDVVDAIATVPVERERPTEEVFIIGMKVRD
jgi:peptidyl-prolyl cis-trans isomerase B (cyclophilin B)